LRKAKKKGVGDKCFLFSIVTDPFLFLRSIAAVTRKIREDKIYRNRCVDGLAISEPKILNAGIKTLAEFGWTGKFSSFSFLTLYRYVD